MTSSFDRRSFLQLAGGAAAGALAAARLPRAWALPSTSEVFAHGVASGDPSPRGAVIWTRVTPRPNATPGSGAGGRVPVRWEVAEDERFRKVVATGQVTSDAASDHTVKVDVGGLWPGREYHYRFRAKDEISEPGRMVTAPAGDPRALRFGVASCSNYEGGYFSAYRHLSERDDLDFVLHLGDYIYEYGTGGYGPGPEIGRVHEPEHEIVSLSDYRMRYGLYRSDPDLQVCHATHPFIVTWDDHEVTNDTWAEGAENHQASEGDFFERRARAYQAYFEWMPVRLPRPGRKPTRIYRRLAFGSLADLHMLDTRQYRSSQPSGPTDQAKDDPDRTITGAAQMRWLQRSLAEPRARWRLIGNQVMITPWETGENVPFNVDAWDGYTADRDRLLGHLSERDITDVVFLTGDIHTSWANEVPLDPTTYPVTSAAAVELVGPSITSDNADEITGSPPRSTSVALEEGIKADNPYVKFVELDSHGYSVADVTPERLQMDWFYISDRSDPEATQAHGASWQVIAGSNRVTPVE